MLDKSTAAKISAYWNSWDEQSFAEHASRGLVYRQEFKSATIFGYVIGKDDQEFPINQLINVENTPYLNIVLTIDAVNLRILSMLAFIEKARQVPRQLPDKSESTLGIDVVAEVGENADGSKYACYSFNSTNELVEKILEVMVVTLNEEQEKNPVAELVKFSDVEFKQAINGILRKFMEHLYYQIVNGKVIEKKNLGTYDEA